MKNKSVISNWAIALSAIAVFSLGGTAYGARLVPLPLPGPIIEPQPDMPIVLPRSEVPVKPAPRTEETGDFKGVLIVD